MRVKEFEISSYNDVESIVNKIRMRRIPQLFSGAELYKQEYYRGQSKNIENFKLRPFIAHNLSDPIELKSIELKMFDEFREFVAHSDQSEFIRKSADNFAYFKEWELLWQAQHFGLPTRLMDWTMEFKVALFFAVGYPKDDSEDGQFWVLSVKEEYQDNNKYSFLNSNPFDFEKTRFINPYFNDQNDFDNHFGEIRRSRQFGQFLFQNYQNSLIPLEEQEEFIPYLEKFIIPKNKKPEIRSVLFEIGYTEDFLLPHKDLTIQNEIGIIKNKYFK